MRETQRGPSSRFPKTLSFALPFSKHRLHRALALLPDYLARSVLKGVCEAEGETEEERERERQEEEKEDQEGKQPTS